ARELVRILIRPGEWQDPSGDVLIEGSIDTPLFLPAPEEDAPIIRVSNELEAMLVEQEIGDACAVIVLGDPGKKPGREAAACIGKALAFLVIMSKDQSLREKPIEEWQKSCPAATALSLPVGTTVFESRRKGTDIRRWIMDALPLEFRDRHRIEPVLPEPGKPPTQSPLAGLALKFPGPGEFKNIVSGIMADAKALHQPKFDALLSEQKKAEAQIRKTLEGIGDPDSPGKRVAEQSGRSYTEMGDAISKQLHQDMDRLRDQGLLTSEAEGEMKAAAEEASRMGRDADIRYTEGMARIESGKRQISDAVIKVKARELPESAKKKFASKNMDPDRIRSRSREDVLELYGRGESLAGAILYDVDLSGLDLHGIDLRKANIKRARFADAILDGADFARAIVRDTDFSKASLKKARLERTIFTKSALKGVNLQGADFGYSIVRETDLAGADLSGAQLHLSVFEKTELKKACFRETVAELSVFSDGDASEADFTAARLFRCIVKRLILDGARFTNADLTNTLFWEASGKEVDFSGADLTKGRMGKNTAFPRADFSRIRFREGCFRDSSLAGATFQGSVLESAMMEGCDLKETDFYRVSAKKSRFSKCNLERADMRGLNLMMGSFRKSRLVNADLSGSNLYGADLYKAVLGNTRLDGANLNLTFLHERADLLK
ncbi:MAG: hypothetical protein C4576_28405, partial [Desulfobacteraceae bacterium]